MHFYSPGTTWGACLTTRPLCLTCNRKRTWNGLPDEPCSLDCVELARTQHPVRVISPSGSGEVFSLVGFATIDDLAAMVRERYGLSLDRFPFPPLVQLDFVLGDNGATDKSTAYTARRGGAALAGSARVSSLKRRLGLAILEELNLTMIKSPAPFPEAWLATVRDELRESEGARAEEVGFVLAEFCRQTRVLSQSSTAGDTTINYPLISFLVDLSFSLPPMRRRGQERHDLSILLRTGELMSPSWFLGTHVTETLQGRVRAARAALQALSVLIAAPGAGGESSSPPAPGEATRSEGGCHNILRRWRLSNVMEPTASIMDEGGPRPTSIEEHVQAAHSAVQHLVVLIREGFGEPRSRGAAVAEEQAVLASRGAAVAEEQEVLASRGAAVAEEQAVLASRGAAVAEEQEVLASRGAGVAEEQEVLASRYREAVAEQLVEAIETLTERYLQRGGTANDDTVAWLYYTAAQIFDFLSETTGYTWRLPDSLAETLGKQ